MLERRNVSYYKEAHFHTIGKKSLRPPEAMSAQIRGQGIVSQYNQIKPFSLEKPIHSTLFLVAAS